MGRKRTEGKISVDVTGMTLRSIAEFDPTQSKLTKRSLSELTSRLVSAANKRLRRMEKSGVSDYSPAYRGRVKKGEDLARRFSVRGKSYKEIQDEFIKAKQFLFERKTSTIAGALEVKSDLEKRLGRAFTSKEEANAYWDKVKELEARGVLNEGYTSGQLQRDVASMLDEELDFDQMLERIREQSSESYRRFKDNLLESEEDENPLDIEEDEEYDDNEDDYLRNEIERREQEDRTAIRTSLKKNKIR